MKIIVMFTNGRQIAVDGDDAKFVIPTNYETILHPENTTLDVINGRNVVASFLKSEVSGWYLTDEEPNGEEK